MILLGTLHFSSNGDLYKKVDNSMRVQDFDNDS